MYTGLLTIKKAACVFFSWVKNAFDLAYKVLVSYSLGYGPSSFSSHWVPSHVLFSKHYQGFAVGGLFDRRRTPVIGGRKVPLLIMNWTALLLHESIAMG